MKRILLVFLATFMFSVQAVASDCFEDPGINDKPAYNGNEMSGEGQQALTDQKYEENSNPAMELMMCAMQAAIMGPFDLVENVCGCIEAIENMCEFEWDYGVPTIDVGAGAEWAWCAAFAPIYLGVELL